MKPSAPRRFWMAGIVAGICFWLSPFVVFVRFQNYPLTHPEILAGMVLLAVFGAISGILMESAGQYTRALIYALLITLTVDIQVQQTDRTTLLFCVFAVSLVVMFLFRNHLPRAGTVILVVMLAVSFVSPTGGSDSRYRPVGERPPGDSRLPIFLHLILDEQIGVEGIPEEFDNDATYATGLRDFYLDHGFRVFGRAFTRYDKTEATLSRMFNFDFRGYHIRQKPYYKKEENEIYHLQSNAYFDLMRSRGYQIHVYQTMYFQMCGDKSEKDISTCFTYGTEAITSIEGSALSIGRRMRTIFGVYSRLSVILMDLRVPPIRLSAVSTMGIMDELQEDLLRAQPGSMFIVHLALPHYPYSYEADCRLRRDPSSWLTATDIPETGIKAAQKPGRKGTRNSRESRAERYPLYLEQMACTHKKLGEMFAALEEVGRFEDMTILVHGDHGSRISIRAPAGNFSRQGITNADLIDSFSTLFAIKQSGVAPGYDRRLLPIGPLFEALIRDGSVPEGQQWAGSQTVYAQKAPKKDEAQPMAKFGRTLGEYEPRRSLE